MLWRRSLCGSKPEAAGSRFGVLTLVLLAHGTGLAWLAAERMSDPGVKHGNAKLVTFDVAPAAPARPVPRGETPPPTRVAQVSPAEVPALAPAITIAPVLVADNAEPVPEGGCDLTDTVQGALRASPDALSAVAALPVSSRSVANAVMLWDGRWIAAASPAVRDPLARLRAVILATVRSASDECRSQLQAGPRLISLQGSPDTVLALGSGRWRWGDLATSMPEPVVASAYGDDRARTEGRMSTFR